jgi:hypothetical protein
MVEYVIHGTAVDRTPPADGVRYRSLVEKGEISGQPVVRFEDDLALFEWWVSDMSIQVRITNKTNEGDRTPKRLTLQLERAEYVDPDRRTHDLVVDHFFWWNRPSRVIKPGRSRGYRLVPADHKTQHRTLFGGPIPWRVVGHPDEILDLYKDHVGKRFRVRLPIRVKELARTVGDLDEVVYAYEFDMTVSKVRPRVVQKTSF